MRPEETRTGARWLFRVTLAGLLALQGWNAVVATRYERRLHDGKRAYNAWELERAITAFDEARQIDDSDADLWRLSGDVALDIQNTSEPDDEAYDPEAALDRVWSAYGGAVLRCPVDSWSWTGMAAAAMGKAELEDPRGAPDLASIDSDVKTLDPWRGVALGAALVAVDLAPTGVQELDTLASVYESMDDLEAAERTYVASAVMVPLASYHTWGGGGRLPRRLYEALLGALQEGIERAPRFEQSMMNVEVAQFAMSNLDYETAIAHARLAESQADGPYEVYEANWELFHALERLGRLEEALGALKRARANLSDSSGLSRFQGQLEERCGRFEDACVTLREALRHEPNDDALRLLAATTCEKAGDDGLAGRILRDSFVLPTDDLNLSRALIDFYRRNGRERTAINLVQSWARDYPEQEEFARWSDELAVPPR